MFYSVANVSELQFFGSVYSQEHLLMTVSDKNICDKQFELVVFPRNLLQFGFDIVKVFPSVYILNVVLTTIFVRAADIWKPVNQFVQ